MKIIVGLGNPGRKYIFTRHNIGFLFLDYLTSIFDGSDFKEESKFKAALAEVNVEGEKVLLVKPTTFMNLSGEAIVALKNFYKLEKKDFLICYDDVDLNFENIRYRAKGSAGTHNGMRSVIGLLGSEEIPRLRFGVEVLERKAPIRDFVLGRFSESEMAALPTIFKEALELVYEKFI
jgi:PTH1 family peptidyl-tRNA hydrolase